MIRLTVLHKTVHTFFPASSTHLGMEFAYFCLKSQETNRKKILWKLWCARLQIGVEGVNED